MATPEIEEFAKLLVKEVRDSAIQNCDMLLRSDVRSPVAMRWRKAFSESPNAIANILIVDCVDKAISSLLRAVDQGMIQISFTTESGKAINLEKEGYGELCGWYNGTNGWKKLYATERYFDDCADLELPESLRGRKP